MFFRSGLFTNNYPEDMPREVVACRLIQVSGRWKTVAPSGSTWTAKGLHVFIVQNDQIVIAKVKPVPFDPNFIGHLDLARYDPIQFGGEFRFGCAYSVMGRLIWWNDRTGHFHDPAVPMNPAVVPDLPAAQFRPSIHSSGRAMNLSAHDYGQMVRNSVWERELAKDLRGASETERLKFLSELALINSAVALQLATKTLRQRQSFLVFLDHALAHADASGIRFWLKSIVPRLGVRRTIAHLRLRIQTYSQGVARARYFLPMFADLPGYNRDDLNAIDVDLATVAQLNPPNGPPSDSDRTDSPVVDSIVTRSSS